MMFSGTKQQRIEKESILQKVEISIKESEMWIM